MATLCPHCRTTVREGEPHPETVCSLVQATRDLIESVDMDREGRFVPESAFERVRAALEALDALTPADLESLRIGRLDLANGPWEVVADDSTDGPEDNGEPSAPKLRIV